MNIVLGVDEGEGWFRAIYLGFGVLEEINYGYKICPECGGEYQEWAVTCLDCKYCPGG